MARGYLSRSIAAAVSRYTVPQANPTIADLNATVFEVRIAGAAISSFRVLAGDAAQATAFALARQSLTAAAQVTVRALGAPAAHYETTCGILRTEPASEWQARQDRYAQQQAAEGVL